MSRFVHLHLHSEYSLLDGTNRIKEIPKRIKELGMEACAITDYGAMYGALEFYTACKKEGVKPIIGCEVYVAARDHLLKEGNIDRHNSHLVLLAVNNQGLRNLNHLVSIGFIDGFYSKPRIDHNLLATYHEGLIALSGSITGEIPRLIRQGNTAEAEKTARWYSETFGKENFYLELQINGRTDQHLVNSQLIRIANKNGLPLVATNEPHYMYKDDAVAQEILLCLQSGKRFDDENRIRLGTDELYIKSPEEMQALFAEYPEALENTVKIAERCQAEFEFGVLHLPKFNPPAEYKNSQEFLTAKCFEGLASRLKIFAAADEKTYQERLNYELDVINSMGYTDYYLIVWDFIYFAKQKNIFVGPGRGSGASSLAAYCLGITNIDPLRYNLIFERFLNRERVSMPDFDIDFCYERRQEVIDYVYAKYGAEKVAQVITFGTMAAKAVVRDVARVMNFPYAETDKIAKMIPKTLKMTLTKAMQENKEFKDLYEADDKVKQIIDFALRLEGLPRHASTHAAGVIISGEPIVNYAPLARNDEAIVVQYTKDYIESIGLLKFDFLGLRTLTVLRDASDSIKQNYGIDIDYDSLDLADPNIFAMISNGDTEGVFQLESPGMTSFIKALKPESLEDIIAGISLYRPGPMDQIDRYVAARHNPDLIKYDHPLLEPILKVTYGCIVYQEQVMQIVRDLAGFSMGMSDIVRRAMAKKKAAELATYEELFLFGGEDFKGNKVEGCVARGVSEKIGRKIFRDVLAFAGYAFNKPHAAAYAVVAYYTAWLRYYYPTEFMAAMLNSFLGDLGRAAHYVQVCHKLHIEVLPLDINYSQARFSGTRDHKIRFALGAVKNVGIGAVNELIDEREANGLFKDPGDFWRRMDNLSMNRKMHESLIRAGALDLFKIDRAKLLSAVIPYLNTLNASKNTQMSGQFSLFESDVSPGISIVQPTYLDMKPFSPLQNLLMEQELIGLYLTGHPLAEFKSLVVELSDADSSVLLPLNEDVDSDEVGVTPLADRYNDGQKLNIVAFVIDKRERLTKNGAKMAILLVEDFIGRFEIVIFPKVWQILGSKIHQGNVYCFSGHVQRRDDEQANLILQKAELLSDLEGNPFMAESEVAGEDVSSTFVSPHAETIKKLEEEFGRDCQPPAEPPVPWPEPEERSSKPMNFKERSSMVGKDIAEKFCLVCTFRPDMDPAKLRELLAVFQANNGTMRTAIKVVRTDKLEQLDAKYHINLTPELMANLVEFWGIDNISIQNIL